MSEIITREVTVFYPGDSGLLVMIGARCECFGTGPGFSGSRIPKEGHFRHRGGVNVGAAVGVFTYKAPRTAKSRAADHEEPINNKKSHGRDSSLMW